MPLQTSVNCFRTNNRPLQNHSPLKVICRGANYVKAPKLGYLQPIHLEICISKNRVVCSSFQYGENCIFGVKIYSVRLILKVTYLNFLADLTGLRFPMFLVPRFNKESR